MIARVILHHSDATELLCRVVCKYNSSLDKNDSKRIFKKDVTINSLKNSFKDYIDLIDALSSETKCDEIAKVIFKAHKANAHGSKSIYNLSKCVRSKEAFTYGSNVINMLTEYINAKLDKEDKLYIPKCTPAETWAPDKKTNLYEDTIWNLFYWDERVKSQEDSTKEQGIVNAYLVLKQFGKAEIYNWNVDKDCQEFYTGYFHFFQKGEYIILELQTGDEKHLNMEIYLGSEGLVEMALGQWHNINSTIYSGTLMITRMAEKIEDNPFSPFFISQSELEKTKNAKKNKSESDLEKSLDEKDGVARELPSYVINYFKDKRLNSLRVKAINKVNTLVLWISEKELLAKIHAKQKKN